jgi:hypothetical protein
MLKKCMQLSQMLHTTTISHSHCDHIYYELRFVIFTAISIPGCLSQGRTLKEAIANIKEAIEGWLEVMESKKFLYPRRLVGVSV